jgi:ADP-heptose:LPS heptosyltransferase
LDNVDVGGITLKPEYQTQSIEYLLGLLNSKLLRWYFPFVSAPFRGGWMSANRQFLSQLPIHPINFSNPADKAQHDQMVTLVEQMLDLHKRKAEAKDTAGQERLQRLIDSADKQIDALVYELYGLTPEEIAVVEGVDK